MQGNMQDADCRSRKFQIINIMTWKMCNKNTISEPYPLSLEMCTAARKLIMYKIIIGK
jgi:hypothetical protein